MFRKSYSTAIACGFGAFIGGLVANQFASHLPFLDSLAGFVGMLVGGFVGYITIDFREICTAIPRAWSKTINWRPYRPFWVAALTYPLPWLIIMLYMVIGFYLSMYHHIKLTNKEVISVMEIVADIFLFFAVILFFGGISNLKKDAKGRNFRSLRSLVRSNRADLKFARDLTPPYLVFRTFKALQFCVKELAWAIMLLRFMPAILSTLGQFCKELFILVHSDRRVVCFMSAATGAGIGFFGFHQVVAGLVAGAVLGFIDYEVVGVRWLKLVPAN
jgi:hypothetical protein